MILINIFLKHYQSINRQFTPRPNQNNQQIPSDAPKIQKRPTDIHDNNSRGAVVSQ